MLTSTYKYNVTNLKKPNLCLDGAKRWNFFLGNNIPVQFAHKNDRDTRVLQHQKNDVIDLREPNNA